MIDETQTTKAYRLNEPIDNPSPDGRKLGWKYVATGKVSVDAIAEAYETVYDRGGD